MRSSGWIPTVQDRAAKAIVEPTVEADLRDSTHDPTKRRARRPSDSIGGAGNAILLFLEAPLTATGGEGRNLGSKNAKVNPAECG
jgi:hypothetical protein